jgi:hypothetical protein
MVSLNAEVAMRDIRCAAALLVLATVACSSNLEPKTAITVRVANSTCSVTACDSLEVLAFPSNQPRTPGGFWSIDLGVITNSAKCFTLPPSATFLVIGVNPDGTRDTTTFMWTTADAVSLGVQAPSGFRTQASPSTTAFVPAGSPGWSITLPPDTHPSTGPAC